MKKEINRTLGNSLRCILPSFWWKRLLGKMVDKIESAESSASSAMQLATLAGLEASDKQSQLVSGSNIKTINHQSILGSGNIIVDTDNVEKYKTKDDLDANGSLAGGDIAAVVDALLIEKPFTECYQPTRSEIETDPYNKKFTKVDGLVLNPDFNPNLISSNYGHLSVRLYSDGKSKGYHKEYPSHLEIEYDYNMGIVCWEYDGTSGTGHTLYDSAGFNAAKIDRVNNILREGDFRFSYFEVSYRTDVNVNSYTYYYSYNDNFPADATTMIDNVVKMLFADTQNADIYVRSAEWVKLLKEGDVTGGGADITIDSELSDISENPVQNKAVKAYVDTEVSKKVDDSIIASIEQQIANKQDNLVSGTSIKTINGNSILGSGDIKVVVDTSNLVTKSEVNGKQDKITDLETIRSGAAKGATAVQKVKTINNVSLSGEGNIELHMSEIHKKLQDIKTVVLTNEEVLAAALNDINRRLLELENLSN